VDPRVTKLGASTVGLPEGVLGGVGALLTSGDLEGLETADGRRTT
jgi:hypothetical protein